MFLVIARTVTCPPKPWKAEAIQAITTATVWIASSRARHRAVLCADPLAPRNDEVPFNN
jgi:hypothetical protein